MSSYYEVEHVTIEESGGVTTRTIRGRHSTRGDAFAVAFDRAQAFAGPERDGWRRPTVSIVPDEKFGLTIKVGDARVDAEYHVFYVMETKSSRRGAKDQIRKGN